MQIVQVTICEERRLYMTAVHHKPKLNAEVLAPAGNEQALQAAFAAGADAVYFGLPLFGARAFAKNFTLEQAAKAIEEARLAGKKIYITMNTLLEEDQMEQAFEYAKKLHEMGADALIIQDLGLIHLLHHRLPDLELHASTQLSVSTPYQIEQLRKLGISRVVLAREATLDEIRACAATGMELEAFIHGALCISYSGQCRFSQVRYGRSGNKGACAQPCRMEYTLEENGKAIPTAGKFLLSPKDLSLMRNIGQLVDAGVYSLKIEGRMKSPEYVYESVLAARKGVDGQKLSESDLQNLKTAFNRGYTQGHTFEKCGLDLMNPETSNHQGVEIGTVISQKGDRLKIRLDHDLSQNDGLRFVKGDFSTGGNANFIYDARGKLTSFAKAGSTVEIKVAGRIVPGAKVRRTTSFVLSKDVENAIKKTHAQAPISMKLSSQAIGQPLTLELSDGTHTVCVNGPQLQKARTAATSYEQISKSLSKTGDTWAKAEAIQSDLPANAFIPVKVLNEMRRDGLEQLEQMRKARPEIRVLDYAFKPRQPEPLQDAVWIMNKTQQVDDGLLQVSEFPLANTGRKASIYGDEGWFTDHLGKGQIIENMNITNSYALAALLELGYQGAVLSSELGEESRKAMLEAFKKRYGFDAPVMMTVYEKPRLMLMKHCPINTALKDGQRKNCSLCRTNKYTLKGKDGKRAILYGNADCRMQIFDEHPVNQIGQIPKLEAQGIHAFQLIFSNEDHEQTAKIRQQFLEEREKTKPIEPAA